MYLNLVKPCWQVFNLDLNNKKHGDEEIKIVWKNY
jgi:hypothetical protein